MKNHKSFYDNRLVTKPWGYEYTIFRNSNKIAITFLHIKYKHKTSLHCHPKKKTGFIIVDGTAQVQLGLYDKNKKNYKSISSLVIRPGLFHSIKSLSKKGLCALEFETPVDKKDLIRFRDSYGREKDPYENFNTTKKINAKLIKLKTSKHKKIQKTTFKNTKIFLENHKNFNTKIKNSDKSISAILDGKIVDKFNRTVITYGEIVKTLTLKKLSQKYKVDKNMQVLRVSK
tara:strand:- start:58 stop:747 length:690 start_codon:yes stop_codon:yes gene_type:complete